VFAHPGHRGVALVALGVALVALVALGALVALRALVALIALVALVALGVALVHQLKLRGISWSKRNFVHDAEKTGENLRRGKYDKESTKISISVWQGGESESGQMVSKK